MRWPVADPVERLCWLYIMTIPLLLVPPSLSRVQLSEGVFLLTMVCFLWQLFRRQRRLEVPRNLFGLCVGLYLVVSAISLVNSPALGSSLLELGVIVYLVSVFLLFLNVIRTREQLWAIAEVWLVGTALIVLIGFVGIALAFAGMTTRIAHAEFVNAYLPFRLPRVFSTMITAKLLSTYLVVSLSLAIARLQVETALRVRKLILALITGMVVTLIFTFSREWVSAIVALMVLWYCAGPNLDHSALRIAGLSAVVVFFLVVQIISAFVLLDASSQTDRFSGQPINARIIETYNPNEGIHRWHLSVDYIWADYLTLKWVAWTMLYEHPWIGTGLGTFHAYLQLRMTEGTLHRNFTRYAVPHSTIFGKAGETGLLGLGVLAALFVTWIVHLVNAVRGATQISDRWLAAAFFAGVTGLLTNSLNIDLMNLRHLWTILALGMGAQEVIRRFPPDVLRN